MVYFLEQTLPYISIVIFFLGLVYKLLTWLKVPAPFAITTFPAPRSTLGRVGRWSNELLLFKSLFSYNWFLWLLSWTMHVALGLIITGHIAGISTLARQFTVFGVSAEQSAILSNNFGNVAGTMFLVALAGLGLRRVFQQEARRASAVSNYLELVLLAGIAVTGMWLRLSGDESILGAVRDYLGGLFSSRPVQFPNSPEFFWHFILINILLMYLPFSRLLHWLGGGIIRVMLTEPAPDYPTVPGKQPRSSFAAPVVQNRFEQPRSTNSVG